MESFGPQACPLHLEQEFDAQAPNFRPDTSINSAALFQDSEVSPTREATQARPDPLDDVLIGRLNHVNYILLVK